MTRLLKALTAAALVGLGLTAPAQAGCTDGMQGQGRAVNPMNVSPPQSYDMQTMARTRAVTDWQANVKKSCPQSSSEWAKASATKVACEGYAGGIECKVTGIPAKR